MKDPLHLLYEEHAHIMSALGMVTELGTIEKTNPTDYETLAREMLVFLREYADKFHHFKEEEVLFPQMVRKNELLQQGVISEMLDNHSDFRDILGQIENLLDRGDFSKAQHKLEKYVAALKDHIAVENEEVFQIAETIFSPDELEWIIYRFEDHDQALGKDNKERLEEMTQSMRAALLKAEI